MEVQKLFPSLDMFIDTYTPEVVGGLIVALLLLLFKSLPALIQNIKIRKQYIGYIGEYYLYNYSSTGIGKVVIDSLIIKSSFGRLVVTLGSPPVYSYKGTITVNQRNIYITVNGKNHIEQVHFTFHSPLHRHIRRLVGVVLSISPIDEPTAKYCLLSDEPLDVEIVNEEFQRLDNYQKSKILRVPKDMQLFFDNLDNKSLKDIYFKEKKT